MKNDAVQTADRSGGMAGRSRPGAPCRALFTAGGQVRSIPAAPYGKTGMLPRWK